MKIAVIADTHGRLPDSVADAIRGAAEIWHLGDFTDFAMLGKVQRLGPPVFAVFGNRDDGFSLPEKLTLERAEKTFLLIHAPPKPERIGGVDFLLHGHTHVPRDEWVNGVRVLNPGTIGKPNHGAPPSYAWLDIDEAGGIGWRIVPV